MFPPSNGVAGPYRTRRCMESCLLFASSHCGYDHGIIRRVKDESGPLHELRKASDIPTRGTPNQE